MRALVLEGIKKIRFAEVEMPSCDETEVLLKVSYCSICRTDAKMWLQGQRDLVLPRILGHEVCGQLLGSDDQYIVWPARSCNRCHYCMEGVENLCRDIEVIGFHRDGGFAQYMKVPKRSLIKIPKAVPPEIACMTELLSSAVNAAEQVNLQKNQKVLIFGGGAAGLMLGLCCRYFGAEPFIIEKNSEKLERIRFFCEKANIHLLNTSMVFDKFDVVINAAPDPNILFEGFLKLKSGGKYCLYSGFTKNINLPSDLLNEAHYRQLTITGAYGSTKRQMQRALEILEGNIQTVEQLIHKIITLENVPSVLPEILQGQTLKYIINVQGREPFGN